MAKKIKLMIDNKNEYTQISNNCVVYSHKNLSLKNLSKLIEKFDY